MAKKRLDLAFCLLANVNFLMGITLNLSLSIINIFFRLSPEFLLAHQAAKIIDLVVIL